ncbi:FliH/SctL family protein [Pilimelia columellifera]|uniref:Flagellar assembly protein FliH/Type III secretion system HrpE domain-containing protein n=1 Tax=Pilimelia columellifera subsp. columellifera TaxID=706583 RepID=A0ABN3NAL7_9ACTN
MSSFPESDPVLRGAQASKVTAASFNTDLRSAVPAPSRLVDEARAAARTAGYAAGWAQGQQAARIAAQAEADQRAAAQAAQDVARAAALNTALTAMALAAASVESRELALLTDLSETIVAAALTLTEAVIGYELDHGPDGAMAAVRRALSMAPTAEDITVRLHPNDHQAITGEATPAKQSVDGREITLRPDATLHPGDAIATFGVTEIDATVAGALARAREVLSL